MKKIKKSIIKQTLQNIKEHVDEGALTRFDYGKMLHGRQGYFSSFPTSQACYTEEIRIDDKKGVIYIELYPGISCPKVQKPQFEQFMRRENNLLMYGSLNCDSWGRIYFKIANKLDGKAASIELIYYMEMVAFEYMETKLQSIKGIIYDVHNVKRDIIQPSLLDAMSKGKLNKEELGLLESDLAEHNFGQSNESISIDEISSRMNKMIEEL